MKGAVSFAFEVIEMQQTIVAQEREITRLLKIEEEYKSLLESSLNHGNVMMGNYMRVLLTPGVAEKFVENSEEM
jgi:hypothetical protein